MNILEKMTDCRKSKQCRMTIIGILMFIVVLLLIFWKKATVMLVVILVLLAVAMGLEGFNYDADLQKLWETGSYSESRVETVKDKQGNSVRLIGECVKADVNCDNFTTQGEAQALYDKCMNSIKENNPGLGDIRQMDIYGLDKNKDGVACQNLPQLSK